MHRVKSQRPYHPVLFAVLPVLFLFSHNIGLVSLGQLVIPILIAVSLAILVWLPLILVIRDRFKAATLASVFLIFFSSYGSLFNLFANKSLGTTDIGQHKYIFPLWAALLLLIVFLLLMTRKSLASFSLFLNVSASISIMIPFLSAAYVTSTRVTSELQ